jgi:hypothetical protein
MRAKTINMFEWKVFESSEQTVDSLNVLLDELAHMGWEVMQVDFDLYQVLSRKSKTLLD